MDRFDELKSKVLTVQDVSNYLRVHPSTIYRMLKKNQAACVPVVVTGGLTVEQSTNGAHRSNRASRRRERQRLSSSACG